MKVLCFDTETTGVIQKRQPLAKQPYIVQRGQTCFDTDTYKSEIDFYGKIDKLFRPNIKIPKHASAIHGITNEMVADADIFYGFLEDVVIPQFEEVDLIVAHNLSFDMNVLYTEALRTDNKRLIEKILSFRNKTFCTMKTTTNLCKIPGLGRYKWPKLQELHKHCFGNMFEDAHNAFADVEATGKCFVELLNRGYYKVSEDNSILITE